MAIILDNAKKILDAGLAKVKAMGVNVSIVVVNGEGNVLLLARMDSAGFLTPDVSLGKAVAAPAFRRSSAAVQKSAENRQSFFAGISTLAHGRFLAGMGGLPVLKDQQILGAVGVSGAKPEEDQAIAQAGIDAL
jgi:uncharacterized protein GlcG (DUF336 family)